MKVENDPNQVISELVEGYLERKSELFEYEFFETYSSHKMRLLNSILDVYDEMYGNHYMMDYEVGKAMFLKTTLDVYNLIFWPQRFPGSDRSENRYELIEEYSRLHNEQRKFVDVTI